MRRATSGLGATRSIRRSKVRLVSSASASSGAAPSPSGTGRGSPVSGSRPSASFSRRDGSTVITAVCARAAPPPGPAPRRWWSCRRRRCRRRRRGAGRAGRPRASARVVTRHRSPSAPRASVVADGAERGGVDRQAVGTSRTDDRRHAEGAAQTRRGGARPRAARRSAGAAAASSGSSAWRRSAAIASASPAVKRFGQTRLSTGRVQPQAEPSTARRAPRASR